MNVSKNDEPKCGKRAKIGHIGSIAGTVICTLLCVIGAAVLILYITGGRIMAVKTASMQDAYPVGSLVVIAHTDVSKIEVQTAVGYWLEATDTSEKKLFDTNRTAVVHRVIENDKKNGLIYTKGDGNNTPDGAPVPYENVIGKVIFSIPYVGYPFIWLGGWTISIIVILIILACILFEIIRSRYGRKSTEDGNKYRKSQNDGKIL